MSASADRPHRNPRGTGTLALTAALALALAPSIARGQAMVEMGATGAPRPARGGSGSPGTAAPDADPSSGASSSRSSPRGTTGSAGGSPGSVGHATSAVPAGPSTAVSSQGATGSSAAATRGGSSGAHPESAGSATGGTGASGTSAGAGGAGRRVPIHEEDDGRAADFLWIEVEGGISYTNLVLFRNNRFSYGTSDVTVPSFDEVEGVGPMFGVAAGFRIYFFALGARATFAAYPGFEIGTVGVDLQFRIPIPIVEPWIRAGIGYAWQGNANYEGPSMSETKVYGWHVNASLGLDIFVTWWLSIGFGVGADFLNMTRQSDPTQPCMGVLEFCPQMDGDAIGLQARGFGQVGLHF